MKYFLMLAVSILFAASCRDDEPKEFYNLESGKDGIGTLLEEYDGLMCIDFLENQSEKNTSIEVLLF